MKRALVLLALLAVPAQAEPADPVFLQRALAAMQIQRNSALDAQAVAEARGAMLAEENAKLKVELDEMKKKADAAK